MPSKTRPDFKVLADRAVQLFAAVQKPAELERLITRVVARLKPGQAIVEIGSDAGGTLFAWRRIGGFVVGIDLPRGPFSSGRRLFDHGAAIISADSHLDSTRGRLVELLDGRPVGFLFIDGDHTYAGAKADYAAYGPLVVPGGLIALHDICHHTARTDVDVAFVWQDIRDSGLDTEEIITPPTTWGGIGILNV